MNKIIMRIIVPLTLINIAKGFTIPDYESVRGPLECLDMKRVEGKFVYEEAQQKTAPVDYPKNVGIVGDYNEYYDEQQCAIFLMTDMNNIIDLKITLHNDNCAVCDVDYDEDFVCDEIKVRNRKCLKFKQKIVYLCYSILFSLKRNSLLF